ncbi:hypothetical protein KHA80_12620 [Anaerobacillus sp. HL2]|nr:hypothetical protein KHA80_12620 [Anaerobacillus sp. HL2]
MLTQNLKTPNTIDLAIHFVSTVIKRNEFSRVKVLFDYAEKMICRYEQDKLFKGEYVRNDYFYRFLVLLARYASDCSAMNHSFIDICKYSQISNNLTNELVETYKLIGGIDSFYNHFQINLAKKTIDKVKSFVKENRE